MEDSVPSKTKRCLWDETQGPRAKVSSPPLNSGLEDGGLRAFEAGILPTPALAFGVLNGPFDLGVMITASHNPSPDNGFKIFSGKGEKLTIEQEKFIESQLDRTLVFNENGRSCVEKWDGLQGYFDRLTKFFPDHFLDGLKIVADLANGATSETTVKVLSHFGAEVFAMNQGEGIINDGVGSEHPELMQELVRERKADFGLAHDGDGDRVIFADAEGNCVHGDQVLGLLALDSKLEKSLKGNGLVATEHSNSGLGASLAKEGIDFFRSEVGDRNVSLLMKEKGCNLGGESSGHAVSSDYLPTGDGLFTGLRVAQAIVRSKKSLRELARTITLWPSKSVLSRSRKRFRFPKNPSWQKPWTRPIFGSKTRGVFSSDIRARSQKSGYWWKGKTKNWLRKFFLCFQLPLKKYCNFPLFVWFVSF